MYNHAADLSVSTTSPDILAPQDASISADPAVPEAALRLLPLLARLRYASGSSFARFDAESGALEECWSVAGGGWVEHREIHLDLERLDPDLAPQALDGRGLRRLSRAAGFLLAEFIPELSDSRARIAARPIFDGDTLRGVLFIAEPWLLLGGRDRLLEPLCELFEVELASSQTPAMRIAAPHGVQHGGEEELQRAAAEATELRRELKETQAALRSVEPRLNALEHAHGRATELLMNAHTELAQGDERARRQAGVLRALGEMLDRHARGAPPRELAGELVRVVSEAFGGSRCSLLLCDSDTRGREFLRIAAALGLPKHVDPRAVRVQIGEGVAGRVARSGEAVVVRGPEDATGLPRSGDEGYTGVAFVCFPLVCHGRFAGVLNLTNFRKGTFDDQELEELRVVALSAALVVDHARLNERLFALEPA